MTSCNVCHHDLAAPVYRSRGRQSLTSLCTLRSGITANYFCRQCSHVQTTPMEGIETFYADEYKILLASEEEDQLYSADGQNRVFRVDHQLRTLLETIPFPPGARILDFGAAKGAMSRALLSKRKDLDVFLFDVSPQYEPYWQRFVTPANGATNEIPAEWNGTFDVVMSFFVLEHIPSLAETLEKVWRLLRPGGAFYFLVPNMYANIADFVVVDHANHFSAVSLRYLLAEQRFAQAVVNDERHQSAFVVHGRRTDALVIPESNRQEIARLERIVLEMSHQMDTMSLSLAAFEQQHAGRPAAIYGSGFYGAYLTTLLEDSSVVACYLDQNPHRQGQELFGKPILAPARLPLETEVVYVGLNPRLARAAIAEVGAWQGRPLEFFFL